MSADSETVLAVARAPHGRIFGSSAFVAFLLFSTVSMAYPPFADLRFPAVAGLTVGVYDVLVGLILIPALWAAIMILGAPHEHPAGVRMIMLLVIAYVVYQSVVVIPVAIAIGQAPIPWILRQVVSRYAILLVPLVYRAALDLRVERLVRVLPRFASLLLVLWGGYVLAVGQAGYYTEGGDTRFRVLWGGSVLLFMWVFADMLVSRPSRGLIFWSAVSLTGLVLANHRSGYLMAGVAVLLAILVLRRMSRGVARSLVAAVSVGVVALLTPGVGSGAFYYVVARFLDATSGNGADRLMRWGLAVQFFVSRPFNDFVWSQRYYLVDLYANYPPHSFVLEIATIEGITGLLFFAVFLGAVVTIGFRNARRARVVAHMTIYVTSYLVFCLLNTNFYSTVNNALLMSGIGLLLAGAARAPETLADGEA
jgi:hypothetical protein